MAELDINVPIQTVGIQLTAAQQGTTTSGHGADAQNAIESTAAQGEDTSDSSVNTHGGLGGGHVFTGGKGGDQTGATSGPNGRGGFGGSNMFNGGDGGDATSTTGAARAVHPRAVAQPVQMERLRLAQRLHRRSTLARRQLQRPLRVL
jgi:hypothetical protein